MRRNRTFRWESLAVCQILGKLLVDCWKLVGRLLEVFENALRGLRRCLRKCLGCFWKDKKLTKLCL